MWTSALHALLGLSRRRCSNCMNKRGDYQALFCSAMFGGCRRDALLAKAGISKGGTDAHGRERGHFEGFPQAILAARAVAFLGVRIAHRKGNPSCNGDARAISLCVRRVEAVGLFSLGLGQGRHSTQRKMRGGTAGPGGGQRPWVREPRYCGRLRRPAALVNRQKGTRTNHTGKCA